MDSTRRHIVRLSRRGLLHGATAAAALAALQPPAARHALAQPVFRAYPFRMGVASGDPLPDGIVLWTRLCPEPFAPAGGMPRAAVEVQWEIATDEAMRQVVQKGTALARPELGHSVHVEATGLESARPYWFRFRAGREASSIGRTRTAPAAGAAPAALRLVSAGCQLWETGHFTAWRHIAAETIDLVCHYGDYIYESRGHGGAPRGVPAVREHHGEECYTLEDYRARYAQYRGDPDLQAAHHAHPFAMSFDDHEVDNNWAGGISEEDGSARRPILVPPELFALRKQAAFQAWYEAMPVRRAQLPRGPSITAYRSLRWGTLAEIAILDTRSFRDDQPCGDVTGPPCADVANPNAHVLGPDQERWLFDRLSRTEAAWKVLAQQVPVMRRNWAANGLSLSMDKWDAYPAARDRLTRHIHDAKVANVAILSGDVHNAWAGTVHLSLDDPASPAVASEFTATSITSDGDGSELLPSTPRVLSRNPHIAFFNNRRGYCLHEITPARMTATFRGLDYVSRPGAPLVDKGVFVAEAGDPRVKRA